jgi:putative acetyltransferase
MKFEVSKISEAEEIKQLFKSVFEDSESKSEGVLIGNLAYDLITGTDEHDLYGFVAIENEEIIGCIFFSRLFFESDIDAFILAPVAIHTEYQGRGIGQKLINFGMNFLKDKGVALVMTYGDPRFYSKVGFKPVTEHVIKAPFRLNHPEGWLGQSLKSDSIETIAGASACVKALNKPEYW